MPLQPTSLATLASTRLPAWRSGQARGAGQAAHPVMPWLRRGDRRAEVKVLQQRLKDAGIDCGPVDGYLGPKTEAAVKRYQARNHLVVDGQVGPQTWGHMGLKGRPKGDRAAAPAPHAAPKAPERAPSGRAAAIRTRLMANRKNGAFGVSGACLRYASQVVDDAGGRPIWNRPRGGVPQSRAARGQSVGSLDALARSGELRVGDIVYANKKPGADPHSTNMAYGPHWFIYAGNGQYIDQHGIKSASAMAAFLPGRRIDTIFHVFDQ